MPFQNRFISSRGFGKKGNVWEQLQKIIASILGLIVILLVVAGLWTVVAEEKDVVCAWSVVVRIRGRPSGEAGQIPILPLNCQTQNLSLGGEAQEIKNEIATRATRCWWMFARGVSNKALAEIIKTEGLCFVCYEFKIDEITDQPQFTGRDIMNYMRDNDYNKEYTRDESNINRAVNKEGEVVPDKKIMSYLDYIQDDNRGRLVVDDSLVFKAKEQVYAITYYEPHYLSVYYTFVQNDMNSIFITPLNELTKEAKCKIVTGGYE